MTDRINKVETLVKLAEKQVKSARSNYERAAQLAIQEFEASGNLGPCQRILDSLNGTARKGVLKRSGYLTWLFTFSPVKFATKDSGKEDQTKLVKDKGKDAVPFNVKGASAVSFWDLSANNDEELTFQSDDVYKAILGVIKKYSRDNTTATDGAAKKALSNAQAFVKANAPQLISN